MGAKGAAPESRGLGAGVCLGILLAATVIAFVPGIFGNFVFDDHRFIPLNPALDDFPGNLTGCFTDVSTMTATQGVPGWDDIYRPLRTVSFAIDKSLFGLRAPLYRAENLAWHLLAVFLAFRLLSRLFSSPFPAALGAGLFALHPLQAQSVSWISSRGDLMAAVFLLGAALLLLREEVSPLRTAAGAALYALALLSKESAIALLAIVPAFDLLFPARPRFRPVTLIVLAAITAGFLALRFSVATGQGAPTVAQALEAGPATLYLLKETLIPVNLLPYTGGSLDFSVSTTLGTVLLLALGAILLLAFARGRREPLLAFGLLWTAFCLGPVSGLAPLKALAEARYAYLPLLGAGMLLACAAKRTGRSGPVLAGCVLALFGAHSFSESRVWTTDGRLWGAAVSRQVRAFGEADAFSLGNLGIARSATGDQEAAVALFRRSIARRPTSQGYESLALAQFRADRPLAALESARRAVSMDPASRFARSHVVQVLQHLGRLREAVKEVQEMRARWPEDPMIAGNLGMLLVEIGEGRIAVPELETALHRHPDRFPWRLFLARALFESGQRERGRKEAEAALGCARNDGEKGAVFVLLDHWR